MGLDADIPTKGHYPFAHELQAEMGIGVNRGWIKPQSVVRDRHSNESTHLPEPKSDVSGR